jgi:hypothetical protein
MITIEVSNMEAPLSEELVAEEIYIRLYMLGMEVCLETNKNCIIGGKINSQASVKITVIDKIN